MAGVVAAAALASSALLSSGSIEAQDVSAPNYAVELVQVITRHGDRAPIRSLPTKVVPPYEWRCDTVQRFLRTVNQVQENETPQALLFKKEFIDGRQRLPGNCRAGYLTDIGFQQQNALGAYLRRKYVEQENLLSPNLKTEELQLRSSDVPRTLDSAQALVMGLYPPGTRPPHAQLTIHTMEDATETLYANTRNCKRLEVLYSKIHDSAEMKRNRDTSAAPVREEIASRWGVSVDKLHSVLMMFDTVNCYRKHGVEVQGIDETLFQRMRHIAYWDALDRVAFPYEVLRLGIGFLIQDVLHNIDAKVANPSSPLKLALFSGHDTTVFPFMAAFHAWPGYGYPGRLPKTGTSPVVSPTSIRPLDRQEQPAWPSYAAAVEVQLLRHQGTQNRSVRVLYEGEEVVLPTCGISPCPLDKFRAIVNEIAPPSLARDCKDLDGTTALDPSSASSSLHMLTQ